MAVGGAVAYFKELYSHSHREIVKSLSRFNQSYRQNSSKYYGWILWW
jgi:hypothetical protein